MQNKPNTTQGALAVLSRVSWALQRCVLESGRLCSWPVGGEIDIAKRPLGAKTHAAERMPS